VEDQGELDAQSRAVFDYTFWLMAGGATYQCAGRLGADCQETAEICRGLYPEGQVKGGSAVRANCNSNLFSP